MKSESVSLIEAQKAYFFGQHLHNIGSNGQMKLLSLTLSLNLNIKTNSHTMYQSIQRGKGKKKENGGGLGA